MCLSLPHTYMLFIAFCLHIIQIRDLLQYRGDSAASWRRCLSTCQLTPACPLPKSFCWFSSRCPALCTCQTPHLAGAEEPAQVFLRCDTEVAHRGSLKGSWSQSCPIGTTASWLLQKTL